MPPNTDKDARPPAVTVAPPAMPHPEKEAVPASRPSAATAAGKPGAGDKKTNVATTSRTHVVVAGDTYSSLAAKYLGSAKHAGLIVKANPGKDAKHLYVGAKLNIPDAPSATVPPGGKKDDKTAAKPASDKPTGGATPLTAVKPVQKETAPPADPGRAYVVQAGEGWSDLARKFLGDSKRYPEVYEHNKERVGGNPDLLRAGTVIELPPGAKMPAPKTAPAKAASSAKPGASAKPAASVR
jgi:nucleoid-associated protein YgaU